jgi:5-methyltetrahydropteroyltriglutamate--homocysteine methyltransferase
VAPITSSDIGSLPSISSPEALSSGARLSNSLLPLLGLSDPNYVAFRDDVVTAFIDKLKMGVKVPNYPQFRDMNQMFLALMEGVEKTEGGLVAVRKVRAKLGAGIPEVEAIKGSASAVRDAAGVDRFRVKVCVTGPYTLASLFQVRTPELIVDLGRALGEILSRSMFSSQSAEVTHVCVDEPVLGFMNDPLLDYGSDGRETLRRAWDHICGVATSRGADTSMHLHNTSENLFWDVEHLGSVMSHVGDPLYTQESVKRRLDETDKMIWATIGVTQFDNLIGYHYAAQDYGGDMPEKIGETWTGIKKGSVDPYMFLEESTVMEKRLEAISGFFGADRIVYASPECGLNSFPGYEVAMECLKRTMEAISGFNAKHV